jgi:hypothetical protein
MLTMAHSLGTRDATIANSENKTTTATVALRIIPCPQLVWDIQPN